MIRQFYQSLRETWDHSREHGEEKSEPMQRKHCSNFKSSMRGSKATTSVDYKDGLRPLSRDGCDLVSLSTHLKAVLSGKTVYSTAYSIFLQITSNEVCKWPKKWMWIVFHLAKPRCCFAKFHKESDLGQERQSKAAQLVIMEIIRRESIWLWPTDMWGSHIQEHIQEHVRLTKPFNQEFPEVHSLIQIFNIIARIRSRITNFVILAGNQIYIWKSVKS